MRLSSFPRARKQVLVAEVVTPTVTSRRELLANAIGCGCLALGCHVSGAFTRGAAANVLAAPARAIHGRLDIAAAAIEARMIAWRRDFHQHPELGNQEVRTAGIVAAHLRRLGYTVRERVATTGVIGVLRGGGGDGPVVALRADMDALPVSEEVDLPFASKVRTQWEGVETGVMHACGHDCHVAILMAAAEVLAATRAEWRGTVKLIFQPAEEGLPGDEIGGARRMLEEGAFVNPKPDVAFALHMVTGLPVGTIAYRPGAVSASSDNFRITVLGRQSHGARPWQGVDPIVIGAQIVSTLQTIQSRQVDVMDGSVLTIGTFNAGNRENIVPDRATMTGTLRAHDEARRQFIMRRVIEVAEGVATSMSGKAEVTWAPNGVIANVSNPDLVERMTPTLARVVGIEQLRLVERGLTYDDFSYFAREVPAMYFRVGGTPVGVDPRRVPTNHSPRFKVDEAGMLPGLKAMLHLVVDYTGSGVG